MATTTTYFGDVTTTGNTILVQNLTVLGTQSYFASNIQGSQGIGSAGAPFGPIRATSANTSTLNISSIQIGSGIDANTVSASNAYQSMNIFATSSNTTGVSVAGSLITNTPVRIGSGVGANLTVVGSAWFSNSFRTTNVSATSANVIGTANVGVLAVTGNVFISNVFLVTNVVATSANVTGTANVGKLDVTSNVGIGAGAAANLTVGGNAWFSNSFLTTNVFTTSANAIGSANVRDLSVTASMGVGAGADANLTVGGNAWFSNSFLTTNVFANSANVTRIANVGALSVMSSIGVGAGATANLTVGGNAWFSNSFLTTNVFATSANLTGTANITTLEVTSSMGIRAGASANLTVGGNAWFSNSFLTTNVLATSANVTRTTNVGAIEVTSSMGISAGASANLTVGGNAWFSNSFWTTNVFATSTDVKGTANVRSLVGQNVAIGAIVPFLAWTFDGTTTSTSGLTGTTTGTVSYNASGKYGQSLVITNTAGMVAANYVDYITFLSTSALTTAVWVKFNTIGVDNQYFIGTSGSSGGLSYVIYINITNNFVFRVQAQGAIATILTTASSVTAGQFYHLATVIDGSNQYIYVNGVLAAGPNPCNTSGFTYSNPTLGGSYNLPRVLVNGELDDLRIFDRALTSAQVQAIYNQQGGPGRGALVPQSPQPSLMWQFESSNVDSVTQLAPTTTVGTPTYVAGKYGQAINFPNSTSTGVSMATNYSIYSVSLNSSTGYTFAFWVNFNVGGIFAQVILSLANSSGVRVVNIYLNGSNQIVSYDNGSNLTVTSPTLNTGTWYHVAISITTSSRVLYLNGVGASGTSAVTGTQTSFILGGDLPSQGNFSAWCSYDDLRVYNSVLTAAQVQAIYGTSGMPSRLVLEN